MSQSSSYHLLLDKLDAFIRKYYLNRLIKGLILFFALLFGLFLALNFLEYFLYLPTLARKVIFFSFIGLESLVFILMILIPVVRYMQLGKTMSRTEAADIIGKHFPEVEDRLLNILQLDSYKASGADNTLIEASIVQKSEQLQPVPFSTAIDLKKNKKYLPYLLPPALLLLLVVFAAPNLITESTTRIIRYDESFEKPAPFSFEIKNEDLQAVQSEDFLLEMEVSGESLPKEVYLQVGDFSYKMRAQDKTHFSYTFKKVQQSSSFRFYANGYYSKAYQLKVLPKPSIQKFEVAIDYPSYTGLKDEVISNTGDLSVPEGSQLNWEFYTKEVDAVSLALEDSLFQLRRTSDNKFQSSFSVNETQAYSIIYQNNLIEKADTISYVINVKKDAYPDIAVESFDDSTSNKQMYFTGEISDDYGLRDLKFKYRIEKQGEPIRNAYNQERISFNRSSTVSRFNHFWDMRNLELDPGDKISYFFEVWDNDAVNGSKSSRSNMQYFNLPGKDKLKEQAERSNEKLKEKLKESMQTASELQEESKKLKEKTLRKSELGWEDKKSMENLLKKQKELQKNISDIKSEFNQNQQRQKEYKDIDPKLAEKQKKLQELFDQVMDEEMKALFEKMEKMLEKMDKEAAMDQLEDMELSNEQLESELDRMHELFKKFELEQKMEETLDRIEELAKKQEELKQETAENKKDSEAQKEKQEELSSELDKIKEELEKMEELAKEAKEDIDMSDLEEALDEAKEESQNAEQELGKKNNKKANDSQQKAQDKMQDAAESLSAMMKSMEMQQMGEDLQALRQLLEHLLILSHDQEELALKSTSIATNDPQYVQLVRDQNKLKDNTQIVKDSLEALSKRVFALESFISKEIKALNKNLEQSIEHLAERQVKQASVKQQNSMTNLNNLALMLSEAMEQMQQQMASQMPGTQQCQQPKPGKGKPSLSEMQKQMNKQLSDMQDKMGEKGEKGKKPDGKEKGGSSGMSKEMAQMAAKQAAIREALRQLSQQENKDGKNSLGDLEKLQEEMNKTETDLVNKQLTSEMIERQQEILTKLLDAEKAMREREFDDERKANTAGEIVRETPPSLEEYFKQRDAEIQLYKTLPPALKPYYKNMVERYFRNITF
ncbi:MAG: DUF4175 family protein [Chitinophagales bacterium]